MCTSEQHDIKVDIWGIGYLLQTSQVQNLRGELIQTSQGNRPTAHFLFSQMHEQSTSAVAQ
ncbi:hypothetical protein THRCLA_22122 [Thraustotheca clavata]|uniref:Protein kinase domain-containing protein n=1 Tax=Thraustotheca clavata TaxID=74557 RepID=A0A1V9ZBY4_9STRA|nr:hypothetical protein THRCLA_22122 [Thraustotheca clavata]